MRYRIPIECERVVARPMAFRHADHSAAAKTGNIVGPKPPPEESLPTGSSELQNSRQLFTALYAELKQLAERQLRRNQGLPLSPTTLLHEAYLGMSGRDAGFPDRQRFMGYAAAVMRGLIIDFVRERRALKRGGAFSITHLRTELSEALPDERELIQLSDAIDELASYDPHLAQVVDLKYFCGYSLEEIAALQSTSVRTVQREWEKARTILFQQLQSST
jgi:RNA polymerase sigma factor (TIGR02999 family)